ncbi:MAG: hypothetical protein A2145_02780 [candidate division Zixibacteria bacterium RBG_16_40_9]|nr:MAG: hypothetical protein A2145_02780 [candidate division Zixibacteria bacterium RBG_16_40_9]
MRTASTVLRIICIAGLVAGLTSSGWGIDRVQKGKESQERKETVSQETANKEKASPETKSLPQTPPDKSDREKYPAEPEKKPPEPDVQKTKKEEGIIKRIIKEDYDYFIDKNKNGIDDRLEIKEKPKANKEVKAKKKKEKPQ